MKLAITQDSGDTTGTNAFTIDNSFNNYHVVPNEYTKVAHKDSNTDMTASTGGVKLTTTYAAYISKTQPADTYSGQVIYTLVHPASADTPVHPDQIGINYHGNGLTFANGTNKNRVVYSPSCTSMYIAANPTIIKTSNLNNDGTQNGPYADGEEIDELLSFPGASRIKVIIDYNTTRNTAGIEIYEGDWDTKVVSYYYSYTDLVGEKVTYLFDIDEITIAFYGYGIPNSEHDYGLYAKVYPIYTTEQANTEPYCHYVEGMGDYAETTTWNDKWYTIANGKAILLADEAEVLDYLNKDYVPSGRTIDIYADNPYLISYNGNGATAGTMSGFYTKMTTNTKESIGVLLSPNFKRTGYGFAGWSTKQNASVNGNDKIYGPNETITGDELVFDPNTRETTLYAVWVPSSGNLQGWTGCQNMTIGKVIALTDTRDNDVYAVGKLADGKCWMMENLRLDNAAVINSDNTNNPAPGFTGLAATSDNWNCGETSTCINQSKLNTNNTNIGGANASGVTLEIAPGGIDEFRRSREDDYNGEIGSIGDNYQWYSYGNYYNFYSATAGNGTYENYGFASGDICPSGWNMPADEYWFLNTIDNSVSNDNAAILGEEWYYNGLRKFPNNFVFSGALPVYRAIDDRGEQGIYWTRKHGETRNNWTSARGWYLKRSTSSSYGGGKGVGHTVRCVSQ